MLGVKTKVTVDTAYLWPQKLRATLYKPKKKPNAAYPQIVHDLWMELYQCPI